MLFLRGCIHLFFFLYIDKNSCLLWVLSFLKDSIHLAEDFWCRQKDYRKGLWILLNRWALGEKSLRVSKLEQKIKFQDFSRVDFIKMPTNQEKSWQTWAKISTNFRGFSELLCHLQSSFLQMEHAFSKRLFTRCLGCLNNSLKWTGLGFKNRRVC